MNNIANVGTTRIGERYQAVISAKARRVASEIKPGKEAMVIPVSPYSVLITVKPAKWTTKARGALKGSFSGIDVAGYLRNLRSDENRGV